MLKKLIVVLFTLMGTITIGYAFYNYNHELNADSIDTSDYYGVGEKFKETDRDYFVMGNWQWRIIYADQDTGKGFIVTYDPYLQPTYEHAITDPAWRFSVSIQTPTNIAMHDTIGAYVITKNPGISLRYLTLDEYDFLTNNETDFSAFDVMDNFWYPSEFFIEEYYENEISRVIYMRDPSQELLSQSSKQQYMDYTHLVYRPGQGFAYGYVMYFMEINLPRKNLETIASVTADQTYIEKEYPQHSIDTIHVTTDKGDGPYHFYIYDTDENGNGNSNTPSAYFQLDNVDNAKGTAEVNAINDLVNGDYYFKVKVVDESILTSLYLDSSDFTKDPNRVKETEIIHVKIKKGTQEPIKVYGSLEDKTNASNDCSLFNVDENQTNVTLYPDGGAATIPNSEFVYTIVSDPKRIISKRPPKGETGTFQLSQKIGSAIIRIKKPGNELYEEESVDIQINVTATLTPPIMTATTNQGNYDSGLKTNQDVTVTFQGGNSTNTNSLKLKELNNTLNPSNNWYLKDGIETEINSGDRKKILAEDTRKYVCYWLYYDGHIEDGVEFRIDSLKKAPVLQGYSATGTNQLMINDRVSLTVPDDEIGWNQYAATVSNHDGTSSEYHEEPLQSGNYSMHITDEYGNEARYLFQVQAEVNPSLPNNGSGYYKIEGTKGKNNWYISDIQISTTNKDGYDQISSDGINFQTTPITYHTDGDYSITFYLKNSTTGIIAKGINYQVKIDQTPPTVPTLSMNQINTSRMARLINFLSFGNWMNTGAEVIMSSSDGTSGIDNYTYIETDTKGSSNTKTSTTGKVTYQDDVEIGITAKACDKAGNCSDVSSGETLMIDRKAPDITGVKDKSVYKYYYLPRFIHVKDAGSGLSYAEYLKDGAQAGTIQEDVDERIDGVGKYEVNAIDNAGNQANISFEIVPLPNIDDIDGSDESKDIIDQVKDEYEDVKDKLIDDEKKEYEDWIKDALDKWESERKKVIETDDKTSKVEGQNGTTFDPNVELIVDDITDQPLPLLPKNANAVYDVYLQKGNTKVEPDGSIKVYLPYTDSEDPIIYQIDENGKVTEIKAEKEGNYVTFITDELGKFAISNTAQPNNKDNMCVVGPDGKVETGDEVCGKPNDKGDQPTKKPDGSVEVPDGGKVEFPNGTEIETPDGAIINPDGSVTLPDGTEYDPDGNVKDDKKVCELDGKDINIDTDGDGLPDLNLDIDHDCIADLNIDTNFDNIPDINIDTKGDGKPDINVDTDGDGKANINIAVVKRWIPNKNCNYNGFAYDTGEGFTPILNIDDDGDGNPDRNIDDDGDGIPDRNIDPDWFDKYGNLTRDLNANIGGANTGDTNEWSIWWVLFIGTGCILLISRVMKRYDR